MALHPVYVSHFVEIKAVFRQVTGMYCRQFSKPPEERAEWAGWLAEYILDVRRLYETFKAAQDEIIYVDDADFERIKKIVKCCQLYPETGQKIFD